MKSKRRKLRLLKAVLVSSGNDDSGQLPDKQNTDQQELELQDEMLSEMGSKKKLKS